MNRWEFMSELAKLLTGIPREEREEALHYYENYFIDAGMENEAAIIEELGSPLKVAKMIRENLDNPDPQAGEFSEQGYTDPRFKEEHLPAGRGEIVTIENSTNHTGAGDIWRNKYFKIALLIVVAIIAIRVILPIFTGIFGGLFGILIAIITVFASLVIVGISIIIAGIGVFVGGVSMLATALPLGLVLMGAGLLVVVLGAIITAGTVKLCVLVYPAMLRGIITLCRKVFGRRDEGGVSV